jgi:Flp pilus assembly protein TadD
LLQQQGQELLAESHLLQATRVGPREARAYELLSTYYISRNRLPEAKVMLEGLLTLKTNQSLPHVNLGTVLLQLKEYSAAVAQLKRALELDPKQPEALHNLARHYLATRQELPAALDLCQRLVVAAPTAPSFDLLGWACYANGRTNDAFKAASKAVELDPTNAVYLERKKRVERLVSPAR